VTWHGTGAEIVQATKHDKIETRFCANVHLLAACERGVRDDGHTFVEGLPRSTLRDFRQKRTFVPAGHEYYDWQEPRILSRVVYFRTSLVPAQNSESRRKPRDFCVAAIPSWA
jgi:AraC family transcriptional regulator